MKKFSGNWTDTIDLHILLPCFWFCSGLSFSLIIMAFWKWIWYLSVYSICSLIRVVDSLGWLVSCIKSRVLSTITNPMFYCITTVAMSTISRIISEVGTGMSKYPSTNHFASYLGFRGFEFIRTSWSVVFLVKKCSLYIEYKNGKKSPPVLQLFFDFNLL